jgi:hypothetical protein
MNDWPAAAATVSRAAAESLTYYELNNDQASLLASACLMPMELRREVLAKFLSKQGAAAQLELLVQVIGMANSVAENCRTIAEGLLVTEGGLHPYAAEKINMPTVHGALLGVHASNGVTERGLCLGCAYRRGTPANQCLPTQTDIRWCGDDGIQKFMCLERLDAAGAPTKTCAGHAQVQVIHAKHST